MPVGAEAENVFVEMLRGGAVVDDEAGMDDLKFFFGLPLLGKARAAVPLPI